MAIHKRTTYRRFQEKKAKKHRTNIINSIQYAPSIGSLDSNNRYIKFPKNSNLQRFLKRRSNKKLRRRKLETFHHNQYRRVYDYHWHWVS